MTDLSPYALDLGRTYSDPEGVRPKICCSPAAPLPWTTEPTTFSVTTDSGKFETVVYHPHLALLKLLKRHSFQTVLDIGCGDGHETELFRFLGKKVVAINADPSPIFKVDFFGDYLNYWPEHQFDCIWCSHVLEHVRNPGLFLDKVFRELKEGGVLALSVPYNEFYADYNYFTMGHHNRYNALILIYQLICAGFDCSGQNLAMKIYNRQISVVVTKKSNGITPTTMAPWSQGTTAPGWKRKNASVIQGVISKS